MLDFLSSSAMGFTAGLALSIFFKRKLMIATYSGGITAGYSFQKNRQYFKFDWLFYFKI